MVSNQYCSYLYYLKKHLVRFICCYCKLIYYKSVMYIMLYFKLLHTYFLITNFEYVLLWYIEHIFRCRKINPQPSNFRSSTRSCYHWNMEHYWGLADHGEGDSDSDIYGLASVNLRQYTTVTNQCEKFPWTWTWRLMYFDNESRFEKRPGRVWFVEC